MSGKPRPAGVTVRKRRVEVTAADGWDDALEACARGMAHGEHAIIHDDGCPANKGKECRCPCEWVGPAVRELAQ